jgi:NTE family protein
MNRAVRFLLCCGLLLFSATGRATSAEHRVGLVLAGGGARGLAHVGVIKYLSDNHIKVHAIAGTSMGAVIGGLYASGMRAERLQTVVDALDWREMLSDASPRNQLSFRRKQDDFDYLVRAKIRFRGGRLRLPRGLVEGQNLNVLLHNLIAPVSHVRDFDRLPIPFRAVAADIETGEAVVLGNGDLADAMRASMSIPGFYSPVELDGRLLVDGGIANNVPVDVVLAMNVDTVIVVDVGSTLYNRDEMDSPFALLDQLTTILTRRNSEEQLSRMRAQDILILPALDAADITNTDFRKAQRIVRLGYEAAAAIAPRLAVLSSVPAPAAPFIAATKALKTPVIHRIEIANDSRVHTKVLRNSISQPIGKRLKRGRLRRDITEIYALDEFSRVDYSVEEKNGENVLTVRAVADPGGASYLKLGLSWDQDSRGNSDFGVRASWRQKALNSLGAEWHTLAQLGGRPLFGSEFYQPLDLQQRFFLDASYRYQERDINLTQGNNVVASANVDDHRIEAAIGMHIGNDAALRLGAFGRSATVDVEIGAPSLSSRNSEDAGWFLEFKYDTLDRPFFPSHGVRLLSRFESSSQRWSTDTDYDSWSSSLQYAHALGERSTLATYLRWSQLELDRTNSALTLPSQAFTLGGFLNLSGFTRDALAGNYLGQANLIFYRRLNRQSILPVNFPVYAGGSIEAANVWTRSRDASVDDLIYAGSLFLGVDSPIGPVYFGIGIGQHDQRALYVRIGQLFD